MNSGDVTSVMDTMSRLSDKVKETMKALKCIAVGQKVPLHGKMKSLIPDWTLTFHLEAAKLLFALMIT